MQEFLEGDGQMSAANYFLMNLSLDATYHLVSKVITP